MNDTPKTGRNVWITYWGRTMTVADWARFLGVNDATLRHRLKMGWPLAIIMTPGRLSRILTRR